ncbi:hypothetical protein [Thermococcus barophilus]|uniref:Uncharacterized protein n=1 Tax=Thermococcus barophilus TaxID=55802 RepID=A0A0S1XFA8_THEBA|nr:hypothetical protein [Thermococcus barophilus]ALM76495.1 conserved membrane hypothetical protein [Thermococcus barophilus]
MKSLKLFSLAFFSYLLLMLCSHLVLKEYSASRSMLPLSLAVILIFYACFVVGYFRPPYLPSEAVWIVIFLLAVYFAQYVVLAPVGVVFLYLLLKYEPEFFRKFSWFVFLLGVGVIASIYLYAGIPFFEYQIRFRLTEVLTLSAYLLLTAIAFEQKERLRFLYFFVSSILLFMSTFRSLLVLMFLAYVIPYYLSGRIKMREILLGILVGMAVLILSGNLERFLVRVGFTFLIFENLVKISLPFGFYHGSLLLSYSPGRKIAFMFTLNRNIYSSFIFGQAVADFGIFGVIEAYLLGAILKYSERDISSLTVVLSLLIYLIEVGIDAFVLAILLFFGIIYGQKTKTKIK